MRRSLVFAVVAAWLAATGSAAGAADVRAAGAADVRGVQAPPVPGPVAVSGGQNAAAVLPAAVGDDWLSEVNVYRAAAGLSTVTAEPTWISALQAHFNYLAKTPQSYFTGEFASVHTENPASPYYTAAGDNAGRSSDLMGPGWFDTPVNLIDVWWRAPFHADGMLRPGLTKVAFAQSAQGWSGLNVISGLGAGSSANPILFPGAGMTTNIPNWWGSEYPDPVETCGWKGRTGVGLDIIAMLPYAPVAGLTATITADEGPDFSTAAGTICVVDSNTYHSTDPVYGEDGKSILDADHAVYLFPSQTLTWSRYNVTIHQPGKADVAWSFVEIPPGPVNGGHAEVLHVTNSGADTVLGNLTVTGTLGSGFTTVYPCLDGRPNASNNNYVKNQTIPNFVAAHPDSNGDICLYTNTQAHLIWDQVAETDAFTAHTPARLLDTRSGTKPAGGSTTTVHVTSSAAQTVLGNLTVTEPSGSGFTTVYPCLDGRPNASNNNYVKGQTIPNFVAAHPDANGNICIYTSTSAHLLWDQVAETSSFTAHTANRLLDTRTGAKPAAGSVTTVHVTDSGAQTVLGNLTVTGPGAAGFTTVYPCSAGRPNASNNNYVQGQTIPNFVAAHPDASGNICIYTSASAHLIWDQVAETSAFTAHTANRIYDTRMPHAFK